MSLNINNLIHKMDSFSEGGYAAWTGNPSDTRGIKENSCKISVASLSAVLFAYKNEKKPKILFKQTILLMARRVFKFFDELIKSKIISKNELERGETLLELVDFCVELELEGKFSKQAKSIKEVFNSFLSKDVKKVKEGHDLLHIVRQTALDQPKNPLNKE